MSTTIFQGIRNGNITDAINATNSLVTVENKYANPLGDFYEKLYKIGGTTVRLNEIKDGKQEIREYCLFDILDHCASENWHNVTKPCKQFNKKTGKCRNGNDIRNGDHYYNCAYHTESLGDHLILAMYETLTHAVDDNLAQDLQFAIAFATLFHDCGKPSCHKLYDVESGAFTGFPFHGETGAAMMAAMWSDEYIPVISKKHYDTAVNAIRLHMCGYHGAPSKYRHDLLCTEDHHTKLFLYYMSWGDELGKVPETGLEIYRDTVSRQRAIFMNNVVKSTLTIPDFYRRYGISSVVVFVIGESGSGKSTFVDRLTKTFGPGSVCHVERDRIMTKLLTGEDTRYYGRKYALLYSVYSAMKDLHNASTDKSQAKNIPMLTDAVTTAVDTWNTEYPDLPIKNPETPRPITNQIRKKMYTMIRKSISGGCITIIDTLMNSHPAVIEQNLPPELRWCFKIHIHVNNYCPRTDGNNVGESLDHQLKLVDNFGLYNIVKDPKDFASISTANGDSGDLPKGMCMKRFTPNYVMFVGRTPTGEFGYDAAINKIGCFSYTDLIDLDLSTNYADFYLDQFLLNMNICDLVEALYRRLGSIDAIKEWFSTEGFNCSIMYDNFLVIKYFEKPGAMYWRYKWAKQCRGIVVYIDYIGRTSIVSFKLPRGAEILTGVHIDTGIDETQDLNPRSIGNLDDAQQEICKVMTTGGDLEGHLTSKADGSLFIVNTCTIDSEFYAAVVRNGDEYVKTWIAMSLSIGDTVYIPATQGTIWERGFMLEYMVTAILCGYCGVDRKSISNLNPTAAFEEYGLKFLKDLSSIDTNGTTTFSFEAICAGRKSAWGETVHTELAIEYPNDILVFLGMSDCASMKYTPHSAITHPFNEPLWWNITHSDEISSMMKDMELIIGGELTEKEFLVKYPPSNKGVCENPVIDYEGWVFMARQGDDWLYTKIKTVAYYNAHKFRASNIDFLMKIADTCGHIFPLARNTKSLFSGLEDKLNKCSVEIGELIDPNNERFTDFSVDVRKLAKKGDPLRGIEDRTVVQRARILINQSCFPRYAVGIFKGYFDMFGDDSTIEKVVKGLVSNLELYKPLAETITPDDPRIAGFLAICLNVPSH